MQRNNNTYEYGFAPEMLLKTKVRCSPAGSDPEERIIGFVETLPPAITAREFRETVRVIEERFSPDTYDDSTLVLRMAALILQRAYVPAAVVGAGCAYGRTEMLKTLPTESAMLKLNIYRFKEAHAGILSALETLRPDIDLTKWRKTLAPWIEGWLDKIEKKRIAEKEEEEKSKEPWKELMRKHGLPSDYIIGDEFKQHAVKDGVGPKIPEPSTPASLQTGVLDYETTLTLLTAEEARLAATLKKLTDDRAVCEEELQNVRNLPDEKEELTKEQADSIEKYRKALESEIRLIEGTLSEHAAARRKDSLGSREAAAA